MSLNVEKTNTNFDKELKQDLLNYFCFLSTHLKRIDKFAVATLITILLKTPQKIDYVLLCLQCQTKYLKQSEEIKENWAGPKIFDIC